MHRNSVAIDHPAGYFDGTVAILSLGQDAPKSADLASLPQVAAVEVKQIDKPTHYLIHILDWPFLDRDAFFADLRARGITDDLGTRFDKHRDDVAAVQSEQKELLMSLKVRYGVSEVFIAGVAKESHANYSQRLKQFKKSLVWFEVARHFEKKIDDAGLRAEVTTRAENLRSEKLRVGPVGQLEVDGVLKALPAEDKAAFEAASAVGKDGKIKIDPKLNDAREDAIVKNILAGGRPVSVLILAGDHDLTDNVPAGWLYIRLTTKAYQQAAQKHTMPMPE